MYFWSFPNRFLNRANHEIIKKSLVFVGLFALATFRTLPIFQRMSIQKTFKFRMDVSWNSWLFQHRFSHRFVHWFLMENGSILGPADSLADRPWSTLFETFSEGRFFHAFWLPFGSFWAPFWLPLAPFWLPLAPFWHPLAHFWRPLAPFWLPFRFLFAPFGLHFLILVDFGSLLALFGSLSPTFSNF